MTTTRIYLEDVTREAEIAMLRDELPRAIRLIATARPDVVVFGCTSAGSLAGVGHDSAIGTSIEQGAGAPAITVIGAALEQLGSARRRVAVYTPYVAELTRSVAACLAEAGHEVVTARGMGIVSNREIGEVAPEEIARFVLEADGQAGADCVFLSCTNWRAVEAIARLERELGIPVYSSNQASMASAAARVGAAVADGRTIL